MSERPYKVEQWSKDFAGVTRLILETSIPNEAHAEFHSSSPRTKCNAFGRSIAQNYRANYPGIEATRASKSEECLQ